MSQFWFDELNIITESGWRLDSQYSGYAGVNGRGEIIDLTIAGTNPTGERRQMPVEPDDGELYGDIVRALRVDYANEILEAMDDWHSSSAATRADQQRDAAI